MTFTFFYSGRTVFFAVNNRRRCNLFFNDILLERPDVQLNNFSWKARRIAFITVHLLNISHKVAKEFCENFVQPTKMLTKTKIFVHFCENFRSIFFAKFVQKFSKIRSTFSEIFAKIAKFVRNIRESN